MTGTAGIRLDPGRPFDSPAARGKGASDGKEHVPSRFGAVLDKLSSGSGAGTTPEAGAGAGAEAAPRTTASAIADQAGAGRAIRAPALGVHLAEPADGTTQPAAPVKDAGAALHVIAIPPTGAQLAEGVAGQIVAALDGTLPAKPIAAPNAGSAQAAAGQQAPGKVAAQLMASGAILPSSEAIIATPGTGQSARAGLTVTRNETHFAPTGPIGDGPPMGRAGRGAEAERAGPRHNAAPTAPVSPRAGGVPALGAATRRAAMMPDATGPKAGRDISVNAAAPALQPTGSDGPSGAIAGPASGALAEGTGAPSGFSATSAGDARRADAPAPLARIAPAHVAPAHAAIGQGPARVLHIRLHPAELGTVTVRMRRSDAGLEVHVEASRQDTLALLQHDRDRLAGILRHAGDTPDNVTLSLADRAAGASQPAGQDGWQQAAPDGRQGAMPGEPHDRERGQADTPASARDGSLNEEAQDDSESPAEAARSHGALYL